jgi:hypothetical protein
VRTRFSEFKRVAGGCLRESIGSEETLCAHEGLSVCPLLQDDPAGGDSAGAAIPLNAHLAI